MLTENIFIDVNLLLLETYLSYTYYIFDTINLL